VRWISVLFLVAVLAAVLVGAWPRMEGDGPRLVGPEKVELGDAGRQFDLVWEDEGTGLRKVEAYIELSSVEDPPKAEASRESDEGDSAKGKHRRIPLHENQWRGTLLSGPPLPTHRETISVDLDAEKLGLPDGSATLVLTARDWSWSDGFEGNAAELRIPVEVDRQPPSLSVVSGLTYVRRGGAAGVVYRVDGDTVESGVRVGEAWFPGSPTPGGGHFAVFAIPIDAAQNPEVVVVAIDGFGNESKGHFDVRVQERVFGEISIALSDRFLGRVATRLGKASNMTESSELATFQRINSELRKLNEAVIADAVGDPTPKEWGGAFKQMRNSSVTSHFAELRHYTYGGERVSIARHYGYDLASTGHAPITASNGGTVIYAGDNGIYGTLVLIDHGLGITTLYGHLSSLEVKVGDKVDKGHKLGNSGATGLAGGDHLHFAILVGRTYVDPIEWWDPAWIRDHIDARMAPE
jgi:murein DD-endopeptidase MepM/ murein hydrolase activator NlpD